MKNFLSFVVFVLGIVNANAQADGTGGGKCSCTSLGCSASKQCSTAGYTCDCSCGLTICSCDDCYRSGRVINPTVSTEQHANRQQLSLILRSFNTSTSTLSANLLDESYQALLRGDVEVYLSKGRQGEENLKNLSLSEKNALNHWIQSKGSDIRI